MSEVVYGRVSQALKQALTTPRPGTGAEPPLVELFEPGLTESAMDAARDELEAVPAASARELEQMRARLAAAAGALGGLVGLAGASAVDASG